MARCKRDLRLEARWRALVAKQPTSGLSVRAFCARERVPECGFYAWRRELRLRDQEQAAVKPAFVPVSLTPEAVAGDAESIVIELRGERVLRLPLTMAMARVTELVRAIEAAS